MVILFLFIAIICHGIELKWKFSDGKFEFSYWAQSNHVYAIVRHDIITGYYDLVHHNDGNTNGLVVVTVNPMVSETEDHNPRPSGCFSFYLTDMVLRSGPK